MRTVPPSTLLNLDELARRYGEAWNTQDLDAIMSFHTEDGVYHLHGAADPVKGHAAIRESFAGVFALLPNVAFREQELLLADWGWVSRSAMTGTLGAPFAFATAVVEPGRAIAVDAVDVIRVADGLITSKHTYVDWLAALTQLGLA